MVKKGRKPKNTAFVKLVSERLRNAARVIDEDINKVIRNICAKRNLHIRNAREHFAGNFCPGGAWLVTYSEELGVPVDYILGTDTNRAARIHALAIELVNAYDTGDDLDVIIAQLKGIIGGKNVSQDKE